MEVISLDILDKLHENKTPRRGKCRHISPILECFAGGEGHIGCYSEQFHENCIFRKRHEEKYGG